MAVNAPEYVLGHSQQELERLNRQGQVFAAFTRALFEQAGIGLGMRVLDVGCGAGDVALLAGELVGSSGEVVAVDRASAAVHWGHARARARGFNHLRFVEGDPANMEFDRPFDAVVGRLVLMYYPDPADALRRLANHVRPGGLVVFQEFDVPNARSHPPAPTFDRALDLIRRALQATGARIQMGLELFPVYQAAGLPAPALRMDTLIGGGPDCPAYENVADVVRGLLPVMEKMHIAAASEVEPETLVDRIRDEVVANRGVVTSPGIIGAWARKPS